MQALCCKALSGVKGFEHKKCFFCGSKQVKKNGQHQGIQQYKCQCCNKYFNGGRRINPQALWQAYTAANKP
ncbi:IS1/IS1595 family N-terminal zinc-binding domain-containing protein, partial [Kingella oralis]|uniref:IS1/IS1595 family N-terminal zinc-binding domain-containing protein n=1 Tax=Kingella oralis TaxID=505 RepID=UPI003D15DB0F